MVKMKNGNLRILAIDPGSHLGYAIYSDGYFNTVSIQFQGTPRQKLIDFNNWLDEVVKKDYYTHFAYERPMFIKHYNMASILMGQIALLLTRDRHVKAYSYTPTEIKKYFTGNGKASKSDMIKKAEELLCPDIIKNDKELEITPKQITSHEADALAIANMCLDEIKRSENDG